MKKYILGIITGVIGMLIIGVSATILYNAKDIVFTPKQNDWNVSSVGEAIEDLYNKYADLQKEFELQEKNFYFSYTGQYQEFTAPMNGKYKIELWGASGAYNGGLGGYTKGEIYLDASDKLYIYVGGVGKQGAAAEGGWNGGGKSGNQESTAGSGGGATDVRLMKTEKGSIWNEFDSLKSRIMVAAGGGGGAYYSNGNSGVGGIGGGLIGGTGTSTYQSNRGGAGGLQTGTGTSYFSNASFGVGGGYRSGEQITGGGGGGYYGGNYGGDYGAGAGGGSSFISGHEGCNAITVDSTSSNIIHTGSSLHYSGKFFLDTVIIDGQGYKWTTVKTTKVGMPTTTGSSTEYGHSGNGYAKITLISLN